MKRRFTAAAVLIGILLVGVFTTVVTSNFVSSQAEKVATDSAVPGNDPDTPGNIVLSGNGSNIETTSVIPQMPSDIADEDEDITETDTDDTAVSPEEEEEDVNSAEHGSSDGEAAGRESESAPSPAETEDRSEGSSVEDVILPQTPGGPSIIEDTDYEASLNDRSDETVISEIGSSGPGDYVSISPLDTAAADTENEAAAVSDPGNGNVTAVGAAAEPAETVKSPLEGSKQADTVTAAATSEELFARLASVEEKTTDQPLSPQAAEYELNLWNYEMNYIADTLRSAMDYDSAESLLQEQLKFLKDRDLAYESGAMENRAQNESDTSYITEATEKTRQRCYYLLETYGDILE